MIPALSVPTTFQTASIPGTGGVLRERPEDFIVEELPAYHPCGEGEHVYLLVQKINMATLHVARILAEHFGVRRDAVGFAGLKDKRAVTTQLFSVHVPGKKPADFPSFEHRDITILWVDQHTNKLRRGHLLGNRFVIRIRKTNAARVIHAHRTLAQLATQGVANRIGEQRFGMLGNNHELGLALLKRDGQAAADLLLGPSPRFPQRQAEARALYAQGQYRQSLEALPGGGHTEKRVLAALAKGEPVHRALWAIEPQAFGFYVTALQSAIFNRVLEERLASGTIANVQAGDLAFKHDSGAVFGVTAELLVADPTGLAERARAIEISPSGPMWGPGMSRATGEVDAAECRAWAETTGLTVEALTAMDKRSVQSMLGQRRPLRVPLRLPDVEAGLDEHGEYIKCVFELPRGSFATTVMQEIMKTPQVVDDSSSSEAPEPDEE